MKRVSKGFLMALVPSVALLLASTALAQSTTTTSTEARSFEIMSVDGNKVLYRAADGSIKEVIVPSDFVLTVDGNRVTVHDLKPGMKGTAVSTTKTTRARHGHPNQGRDRGPRGVGEHHHRPHERRHKKFTTQDVRDRNITVYKEGAPVELSQLRVGDRLSATIVTKHPPVVMTERQVKQRCIRPPGSGEGGGG